MNNYKIITTNTFIKDLKKYKKNRQIFIELEKKINILKKNPYIGKKLSRELHPSKSTRLDKKNRLIFQLNSLKVVYLKNFFCITIYLFEKNKLFFLKF